MQSASPLAPWATISLTEGIRRSKLLAKKLGCDPENQDRAVLDCLRKVPAKAFTQKESEITEGYAQFPFVPVVDGTFLTKSPQEYLAEGNFKKIPLLMGSNTNEGTWLLVYQEPALFNINTSSLINSEKHSHVMDRLFRYHPQWPVELGQVAKDAVKFQYTDWVHPHDQVALREEVEQAVGDFHFVCGVVDMATTVAAHGQDVYMYRFSHRMSNHPWPPWMGVLHGDEIFFVFGRPLVGHLDFSREEKKLSRKMMKYWANFAKTGNPNNGPGETNKEEWPRYAPERLKFLDITTDIIQDAGSSVGVGVKPQQCAFWGKHLPILASIERPTYNSNCTRSSPSKSGAKSLTSMGSLSSSLVVLTASMSWCFLL
ncbi:carboxylic ester hydrolase [Elysia marginata]|uniref:Carboxylic ester hydrolase n=1 Tax=Elysia marginata TaxID=1093978 RepID=A0AAV4JFN6_9GAST|nr:carboxylic ester hydrolase [Elysia marginata]